MPSEHRLHPSSVLFSFGAQLKNFALPALLVLVGAGRSGGDWEQWLVLLLIPNTIFAILRYVSFRYRYEENEMVIRTGVLFRNERHVPYARIQNLDAVQNVLHRLIGVFEVRVQTGGGTAPEAVMSVIPAAAYDDMRRRVFAPRLADARSGQGPRLADGARETGEPADVEAAAIEAAAEPVRRPFFQMPIRELMICGFIENRGMLVIGAGFGILAELGLVDRVIEGVFGEQESARGAIRGVFRTLFGGAGLNLRSLAIAAGALAGVLLLVRLLSMAWAVVRLYGFQLTRAGDDLRMEFGLLTRITATIPRRRIQTLTFRRGLLHALFDRCAVKVETAGGEVGEATNTQRSWLAPLVKAADLDAVLREVLPELDLPAAEWQRLHPRAFARVFRGSLLFWIPVSILGALWLSQWWRPAPWFVPLMVPWCYVAARKVVEHAAWAIANDVVMFRTGWIWKRVTVARVAKVQTVTVRQTPFDRRWTMASVRVDTAGADDATDRVNVPYLPAETAHALYARLAHAAARTEFRW